MLFRSEVDLQFSSHSVLEEPILKKIDMKPAVRKLFDADTTFKSSVYKVLATEPDFKSIVENKKDLCVKGKCKGPKITPQVTLFDGTEDVTFQRDENDNVYMSSARFPLRKLVSKACNPKDDDGWDDVCMDPNASHDIQGFRLEAFKTSLAPTYKVTFSDERQYIVQNTVMMDPKESNAKEQCALKLCSLQSVDKCPSAYCTLDGGKCLPRSDATERVLLRDVIYGDS